MWSRARGPYGYLRTWNWPITAREISQPYNEYMLFTGWEVRIGKNCDRGLNMLRSQFFPIRTDHKPVNNSFVFFFQRISKSRGEPEARQRAQGVFHKKYLWKFWKIFGNLQKLLEIFGNSSKVLSIVLWFFKFLENLRKSSEAFGNLRKFSENFGNGSKSNFQTFHDFLEFSEIFGNLRKCSEIFGNFRKTSEKVQKKFLDVFMIFKIFGKSSEIFGSVRKSSELFGKLRKLFKSNFQMFLWFLMFFKNAPRIYVPRHKSPSYIPSVISPRIYAPGYKPPGYKSPDMSPQDMSPRFLAPGYNPPDIGPDICFGKKILVESSRITVLLVNCTAKIPGWQCYWLIARVLKKNTLLNSQSEASIFCRCGINT